MKKYRKFLLILTVGLFLVVLMTSFNVNSDDSNDSQFVEVDGIRFETLLPQPIVTLPKKGEKTTVQFGVRITNLTSTPCRFDLQRFLPDMLHPCGKLMYMDLGRNTSTLFEDSDVPLILPSQSVEFLINGNFIHRNKENSIQLTGPAIYGGVWRFYHIQPGKYRIRLWYENNLSEKKMISASIGRTIVQQFWIGKIKTPFSDFTLQ